MGFHHCRLRGTRGFKPRWGIAPAPSVKWFSRSEFHRDLRVRTARSCILDDGKVVPHPGL